MQLDQQVQFSGDVTAVLQPPQYAGRVQQRPASGIEGANFELHDSAAPTAPQGFREHQEELSEAGRAEAELEENMKLASEWANLLQREYFPQEDNRDSQPQPNYARQQINYVQPSHQEARSLPPDGQYQNFAEDYWDEESQMGNGKQQFAPGPEPANEEQMRSRNAVQQQEPYYREAQVMLPQSQGRMWERHGMEPAMPAYAGEPGPRSGPAHQQEFPEENWEQHHRQNVQDHNTTDPHIYAGYQHFILPNQIFQESVVPSIGRGVKRKAPNQMLQQLDHVPHVQSYGFTTMPVLPSRAVDPHVYHPDKATNGLGERKLYACGYCGYKKYTCSTGSDGQVRIRCKCGGMQSDGVLRMHAYWILQDAKCQPSDPNVSLIPLNAIAQQPVSTRPNDGVVNDKIEALEVLKRKHIAAEEYLEAADIKKQMDLLKSSERK